MKILVDADACPVKNIIINVAKEFNIKVTMFIDTSHELNDGYSDIVVVDKGKDAADMALIKNVSRNDIVVTQDYGVAAIALPNGASALNQNGLIYTDENIDMLLYERYIGQKIRNSGKRTKGPKKRTKENDIDFETALRHIVYKLQNS